MYLKPNHCQLSTFNFLNFQLSRHLFTNSSYGWLRFIRSYFKLVCRKAFTAKVSFTLPSEKGPKLNWLGKKCWKLYTLQFGLIVQKFRNSSFWILIDLTINHFHLLHPTALRTCSFTCSKILLANISATTRTELRHIFHFNTLEQRSSLTLVYSL